MRLKSLGLWALFSLCAFKAQADVITYHNATAAEHQQAFNKYARSGYRLSSISVHGDFAHQNYAAVWVKQNGPAWSAFHNRRLAEYQGIFNEKVKSGYCPKLLSAAGEGAQVVVAGTFEKCQGPVPLTRTELQTDRSKSNSVQVLLEDSNKKGLIPTQFSVYGSLNDPHYAVIFAPNTEKLAWNYALKDTAAEYQKRFSAYTQMRSRPLIVSISESQRYASIFVHQAIEGGWIARHDMSWNDFQTNFDRFRTQGWVVESFDAGGFGNNKRWGALWAKSVGPKTAAKTFKAVGLNVAALAQVDTLMKNKMSSEDIPGASVAITYQGRLVYAKGYSFAENGYPEINPTTLYRVASLSKPMTSIAIHQLVEKGSLDLNDNLEDYVSLKDNHGKEAKDSRLKDIKIWHLLSHAGGWDRSKVVDLPNPWDVAKDLKKNFPISKSQWFHHKFAADLQFDPGTKSAYSNLGYGLLGLVLEKKYPGKTYEQIVKEKIFSPLGLTRPRISASLYRDLPKEMAPLYDTSMKVVETVVNGSKEWVGMPYGGEDFKNFDAFGGWLFSAVDYAKVLAEFSLKNNRLLGDSTVNTMWQAPLNTARTVYRGWFQMDYKNGRSTIKGRGHGGSVPGISTTMVQRDDDISVVLFFNKGGVGTNDVFTQINNLATTAVPGMAHDYFAIYGVPNAPR